jgi:helix-turn-helix, Psq domain
MGRVYTPKPKKYTVEELEEALSLIKAKKLSVREAAKKYVIDKSLLSRRLRGVNMTKQGRKTALSCEQEGNLAANLKTMAKWGFALSKAEILSVVANFVSSNDLCTPFKSGQPGTEWFLAFCSRNKLSVKKMEQLESSRRKATSDPFIIYDFFKTLKETVASLKIEYSPEHIWNLDESGFSFDPSRVKGVAGKGQKVHRNIAGSGKENTTVMACISAAGKLLPLEHMERHQRSA